MKQQLARREALLAFLGSTLTHKNLAVVIFILFALSMWWQRERQNAVVAAVPVGAVVATVVSPVAAPVAVTRPLPPSRSFKIVSPAIQWMRDNVRVAILSTHNGGYLKEKLHWMLDTWLEDLWDIVTVVSDSADATDGLGRPLPGYIDAVNATGCDTSMDRGLWCKNTAYLKVRLLPLMPTRLEPDLSSSTCNPGVAIEISG